MFMRFLSSAAIGGTVTALLMYGMQLLIEIGPGPDLDEDPPLRLAFSMDKTDETLIVDDPIIERIDPPEKLPPARPAESKTDGLAFTGLGIPAPPNPGPGLKGVDFNLADNALVNIIRVSPTYPIVAARRGLEGYVTVRFDVTALGTVENVTIVESSDRIFEQAAIAAALRFRYKARVVDGDAIATTGLMNRFTFKMED